MDRQHSLFDEQRYPIARRFEARDCGLSGRDKQRLCLYQQAQSQALWGVDSGFVPDERQCRDVPGQRNAPLDFKRRADGAGFFTRP